MRDSGFVGDMGGVIGTMDRESFLAIGWKTLRPLSGRGGAMVGKEVDRGAENMAVWEGTGGWRPLVRVCRVVVGVCCNSRSTYY